MSTVKFSHVFPSDYLEIMNKYAERIETISYHYDVIIFMARKAICFYKAMKYNEVIAPNDECLIMSSRVLSYNVSKSLFGKRVAIVDDVVIKGKSVIRVASILEKNGILADIHIVAGEKVFIEDATIAFSNRICSPYVVISETEICQLSSYITTYIEASMYPNNIDQPVFKIAFKDDRARDTFLRKNKVTYISSGIQNKYGIASYVIHFENIILEKITGISLNRDGVYVKIRFFCMDDSTDLIALPFVLLPILSIGEINELFAKVHDDKIDQFITLNTQNEINENKLKIVQYILSYVFFTRYSHNIDDAEIIRVSEYDLEQFSVNLSDDFLMKVSNKYCLTNDLVSRSNQKHGYVSLLQLNEYIGLAYDYIFNGMFPMLEYLNFKNEKITDRIITINDLQRFLENKLGSVNIYVISNIIDIFIDRGILIPTIVHTRDEILRAYKCGEIFNLTKKGIQIFAYMLYFYSDMKRDVLDKIEYEKLCVLFFKKMTRLNLFSPASTFDDDCFSVFYSKFGPRVTSSGKVYNATSNSAMCIIMEDRQYLEKVFKRSRGEKYQILRTEPCDKAYWNTIAVNFASHYHHVRLCFGGEDPIRNHYIHTFNDFLTLLAIGENKKNQMYALMAEVDLISRLNFEGKTIQNILLQIYRVEKYNNKEYGIIDGIASGLWKYFCFCSEGLLKSVLLEISKQTPFGNSIMEDLQSEILDDNNEYHNLIDECGELLFEFAYVFNMLMMGTVKDRRKVHKSLSSKKEVFFFKKMSEIRQKTDDTFAENSNEKNQIKKIKDLQERALALTNICDLCIAEASLKYDREQSIFVLYFPNDNVPNEIYKENSVIKLDVDGILKKCVFLYGGEGKKRSTQFSRILALTREVDSLMILYCEMDSWYRGVFNSIQRATGSWFKEFVLDILIDEEKKFMKETRKLIFCGLEHKERNNLKINGYDVEREKETVLNNGYNYQSFWLSTTNNFRRSTAEMDDSKYIINNYNNGGQPVIQIGSGNNAFFNVDWEKLSVSINELKSHLEMKNNDSSTAIAEIEDEIVNKNEAGVFQKLGKLVQDIGGPVFEKMASSFLIELMSKNGFWPI